MIYFLLDGARCEQPVYRDLTRLSDPPCSFPRLGVGTRVPVRVEDDHAVSARQVHAQSSDPSREQKHIDGASLQNREMNDIITLTIQCIKLPSKSVRIEITSLVCRIKGWTWGSLSLSQ